MRTLIYKRTHSGDPDPHTGVFGNHDCMGMMRGWRFDAVIGIGGAGSEPQRHAIAYKLTWIGIGPRRLDAGPKPRLAFKHFLYFGERGKLLKKIAPNLAKRMYRKNVRFLINSLSAKERSEIARILRLAKNAPRSSQQVRRNSWIVSERTKPCHHQRKGGGLGTLIVSCFAGKGIGIDFEIPEWHGEEARPATYSRS